jgi:hypothetical protein
MIYEFFDNIQKFWEGNICPLIDEYAKTGKDPLKVFNAMQDGCVGEKTCPEMTQKLPDCEKDCLLETIWSVSDSRSIFYPHFKKLSTALLIHHYRSLWYNEESLEDKLQEEFGHLWNAHANGKSLETREQVTLPTDKECQEVAKQFLIDVFGKDGIRDQGLKLVQQDQWKL